MKKHAVKLGMAVAVAALAAAFLNGPVLAKGDKDEKMWGGHGGGFEKMEKKLNLTEDQKAKMKALREELRAEMKALHESHKQKVMAILNDEQKAKFEKIHGNMENRMEKRSEHMEKHEH